MPRFSDRVAVVTGGAMGIGGATARQLAEDGARVLVVDIVPDGGLRNVETIRGAGGTAECLRSDVSTEAGVQAAIERAVSLWGRLDIVVNNAFALDRAGRGDAVRISEEEWDQGMNVGLKAMFRAARFAVPHLRAAGGGAIVNMSSVHGLLAEPGQLVYETLKAGVIGLTRQLAVEYGPDNIRVNAICPGHIVTERMETRWGEHPETLRYFEEQYPLRRTGTPKDIANAIAFLCSDEASFITGQALVVDGGLSIQLQEHLATRLARYAQEHVDTLKWYPH
ncbi:MAG: SDR family oxidoreductase [Chloroflexi bacterium]|nr:SDR family oxidoreductase [Chloroflexota bacterium]MBV9600826.1 SDR family oxidoreductase [Chloroflexota bacterium]